jgi:hypothetical protein
VPNPTIFYFDRSVGRSVPDALRTLRVPNVVHQHLSPEVAGLRRKRDQACLFPDDTPDDVWLEFVGRHGWVAFSQDYKMHTEDAPLAAIRDHGVRVFYLWGANESRWEKMRALARAWDGILRTIDEVPAPFVRRVLRGGQLEVVDI